MCSDHIHPHFSLQLLPDIIPPPPLNSVSFLLLLFNNLLSPVSVVHILWGCGAGRWSVVNLTGATPWNKTESPSFQCYQLPLVPPLGVEACEPLPLYARALPALCRQPQTLWVHDLWCSFDAQWHHFTLVLPTDWFLRYFCPVSHDSSCALRRQVIHKSQVWLDTLSKLILWTLTSCKLTPLLYHGF